MYASSSSPSSPTSPGRRKNATIPGFRPSPRQQRPIRDMTVRELQDRHQFNIKLLSSPNASTSTYAQRVLAEQAEIEKRLMQVDGMETINTGLRRTKIRDDPDDSMAVDTPAQAPPAEQPGARMIDAKRRALARWGGVKTSNGEIFTMSEAMEIEREAHQRDKERQERILEKKKRLGLPIKGEQLTMQEREARIMAFMNHKPTESDMEDDSEDEDDDDPASWFDDDQDDGRKEQQIVYPDEEDYSDLIRVDASRAQYSTFYEPRDEGD